MCREHSKTTYTAIVNFSIQCKSLNYCYVKLIPKAEEVKKTKNSVYVVSECQLGCLQVFFNFFQDIEETEEVCMVNK